MSESENHREALRSTGEARKKAEDSEIVETFAEADAPVLTTSEVVEELNISDRQARRRLKTFVNKDVVETRRAAGIRIWWLADEVEEPITVRYPLLRLVRDRGDVLTGVLGAAIGLAGAFGVTLFIALNQSQTSLPFLGNQTVLLWSLYLITGGIALIAIGVLVGVFSTGFPRLVAWISD